MIFQFVSHKEVTTKVLFFIDYTEKISLLMFESLSVYVIMSSLERLAFSGVFIKLQLKFKF